MIALEADPSAEVRRCRLIVNVGEILGGGGEGHGGQVHRLLPRLQQLHVQLGHSLLFADIGGENVATWYYPTDIFYV